MNNKYIIGYVDHSKLALMRKEDVLALTHINIAFGLVREGKVSLAHTGGLKGLERIREYNSDINIVLSVGGWGAGGFSIAASTAEGRQVFADSCVEVVKEYKLSGIDLDWEYPSYGEADIDWSVDDKENFTLLLECIRKKLNEFDDYKILSIAAGADQYYVEGTDMAKAQQYLDYVQLMTYDMRGGFQVLTGHHTNLYNTTGDLFRISTKRSVEIFHKAGVPKEKIIIGAAFYSRKWENVPNKNNGLFQMAGTTGGYGPSYVDIKTNYLTNDEYTRYWDDEAKAPYIFNGSTFISYDDSESVAHKCEYLLSENLMGVMFWVYTENPENDLIDVMHNCLRK